MTKAEQEEIVFREQQFAKTNAACEKVRSKFSFVKQFEVLKKYKFWKTWAQVNGYSHLVKKTHRFVAVLKLEFGNNHGTMFYSVSNPEQPEIAALDVLKTALAGWTPIPNSHTIKTFPEYAKVTREHFKDLTQVIDAFAEAMEA